MLETVRSISCLSGPELQVLAERTVSQLNNFLKTHDIQQVPSLEKNMGIAYRLMQQNATKNSGGILSSSFLRHRPSPMLMTSRGFKTKRSDSTTDKPFTKMNSKENSKEDHDEAVKDILKNLDISTKEKEKINIALLSYAAGATRGFGSGDGLGAVGKATAEDKKWWNKFPSMKALNTLVNAILVVAIIVMLARMFGVSFNMSRLGGNEIKPEDIQVTFDDVKGCDEAKRELEEVVQFLKYPEKFSNLGGELPKGLLLVGPPGTGKTLLSRAVAGEAGVPFFHASGSEFDEVLVGQGARRVRDLFKVAKSKAPCVLFIDEIDSVGGKRTSSSMHPYANQTINMLLSEMDGFMSNEGVIVLGATNVLDNLDPALLRPGRFDTQVYVGKPDVRGRIQILELYLSKIKHDNSVDIEKLARLTVGCQV
jgi:ATP-dependent metalloprotease